VPLACLTWPGPLCVYLESSCATIPPVKGIVAHNNEKMPFAVPGQHSGPSYRRSCNDYELGHNEGGLSVHGMAISAGPAFVLRAPNCLAVPDKPAMLIA
jgi:hypothetical protein